MSDDEMTQDGRREYGRRIDADEVEDDRLREATTERPVGRRIPVPEGDSSEESPPESISAPDRPPSIEDEAPFHLEPASSLGIRRLLYLASALLGLLLLHKGYTTASSLWSDHWTLGVAFLVLFGLVTFLALRATYRYLYDPENIESLSAVQELSEKVRFSRDKGRAESLIRDLKAVYQGKPQEELLDRSISTIEYFYDDSEVLAHLERNFFHTLDEAAVKRVSQHCLYTGAVIAISPWAVVDVALALWRNVQMMEEISSIYGCRPTLRNRIRLFKMVAGKMVYAGASQAIIDTAMEGISSLGAGLPVVASFAQGVGASVYTGRIGIATMHATRPIGFGDQFEPTVSTVVSASISSLGNRLAKKVEKPA